MAKRPAPPYLKINGDTRAASLDTTSLFGSTSEENSISPIDIFIKKNKYYLIKLGALERDHLIDPSNIEDIDIYNLFLLGLVSNVESYYRRAIRKVILIDERSYNSSMEEQLTYAAALHHNVDLLPEALLEGCSFISYENIKNTVNTYINIGVNKQKPEQRELIQCLEMFEQLCHLRHCIVHRAGLLGSKNAIKLGIDKHKSFFEKPIILNLSFLQEASFICLNSVKTFNDFAFNSLIHRYIDDNKSEISWDYRRDKVWFLKYYKLFESVEINNDLKSLSVKTHTSKQVYDELREYYA
ncbi:hypothetical protein RMB13_15705 [Acinetobacter sp. V102_4]|uniref:hypothetical protein n=1 Tax=Acinetobacter sp. V102_4 TaxID=3072984 RepID=UPI00287E99BD|nr:hypothetical protein [Acinetobacter sp. V102_4]MDS7930888.1 hypothetical protein [Acinetobacter sp. V102_4]